MDEKNMIKEYIRKWQKEHPENLKRNMKKFINNKRKKCIQKLGDKCMLCGNEDERVLQFHHLYHDGNKHDGKSNELYKEILNDSSDIVLLCANCHIITHYLDK